MSKSIEDIYKERPAVLSSTIIIWLIKLIAILLMLLFFGSGIGLLLMPDFWLRLIEDVTVANFIPLDPKESEQLNRFLYFIGIISLLAGLAMVMLVYFSNLVLARNRFIKSLENWHTEQYNNSNEG